jgi:hypothetical protein
MIRKTIINLFSFSLIAALLSSCGSGNNVVSSLGKRKYTKGFYLNLPSANERVATISDKVVEHTTGVNRVSESVLVPVAKSKNAEVENICNPDIALASQQVVRRVSAYENKRKNAGSLKALKPDNDKYVSDNAEDERKEKQLNRVLGIVGFTAAVAGAILLFMPNFPIAGACLLIGLIISAIGIKRGSSSLLAFFGFIISAIGALALLDILIVVNQ